MKSPLFFGVAAAAAASLTVIVQAPAQAACYNPSCSSFDQSTDSDVINANPFTGTATDAGGGFYQRLRLGFTPLPTSSWTYPIVIKNVSIISAGGIYTLTPVPQAETLTFLSNLTPVIHSVYYNLSPTIPATNNPAYDFADLQVSFTIEGNAANPALLGAQMNVVAGISGSTSGEVLSNPFVMTASLPPVPGPLPLLGAGAAFGFSRKLRNRLKVVG